MSAEIVSNLLMSFDHLRRSPSRRSASMALLFRCYPQAGVPLFAGSGCDHLAAPSAVDATFTADSTNGLPVR